MDLSTIISMVNDFVWGPVMLFFFVGTGIFLTVRLKFRPWLNLPYAIKSIMHSNGKVGDLSPFQALMMSLSACVGTGNIVGVPTAMVLGGPGALVWMWISAVFGLSTKYAESLLAVKYRISNDQGEMSGGPMYAMRQGIGGNIGKILAVLFSVFAVCASFGIGNMTQANSIASALDKSFGFDVSIVGIILVILCLSVFLRGVRSIGLVSSVIVPAMTGIYIISAVIAIIINAGNLPAGLAEMFNMAFSPSAVAGGVGGSIIASMLTAMRWGVARGVFSNEAGLGSGAIAAAAAKTSHPSEQGYVNMTATFFDTMIICMLTGLVIASSGALGTVDPQTGALVTGADLAIMSFSAAFGDYAPIIVSLSLALFAFSTILGWEYFGEKALEYLIGSRIAVIAYRFIFSLVVYVGATQAAELVWNFSDTANGLMAIPNLICLLWLSKEIVASCDDYQKNFIDKGK